MALLLSSLVAGAENDARADAWAAWNAAETGDREVIPLIRAHLDDADTDPEKRRLAMVALDSLIRLQAPTNLALIRRAEELGAHVQALVLASRAGAEGEAWAREAVRRFGDHLERADQRALLDMVASQCTPAAAAAIWRDSTAVLKVVIRDPPNEDTLGPMGMFGSRSGGGRKRASSAPWPEVATYRILRQGGETLPGLRFHFGWERTTDSGGNFGEATESLPVRLLLLAAMAQAKLERPVAASDLRRKIVIDWQPGSDPATAVRMAQEQQRTDWARFHAELIAAGLAPAAPVVKFLPPELVDARCIGQDPLEAVNGIAWQLAPALPLDPEKHRQRKAAEQAAFEQVMRQMDARLETFLNEKEPKGTPTER